MISFFEEFNSRLFDFLENVSLYIPFAFCVGLFIGSIYVIIYFIRWCYEKQ